jgi:hypothetical protein
MTKHTLAEVALSPVSVFVDQLTPEELGDDTTREMLVQMDIRQAS